MYSLQQGTRMLIATCSPKHITPSPQFQPFSLSLSTPRSHLLKPPAKHTV